MPIPYDLVAVDLDDTLLGPDHQISPRNARAVKALHDKGVRIVLASGRMHEAMLRFAEALGTADPIISYNGSLVKDPETGEIWIR